MKRWIEQNLPDTAANWRRMWFGWRLLQAERALGRAARHYTKAGELNFALEAYELAIKSAMRLDRPHP